MAHILFFTSGILIIGFFAFKIVETKRNLCVAKPYRQKADMLASRGHVLVCNVLPRKVSHICIHAGTSTAHSFMVILLRGTKFLEQRIVSTVNIVRGKRELYRKKASSSFLEDISNHKKQVNADGKHGYYEG
jgi:hypothetical protein